jgi:hypothetical protein
VLTDLQERIAIRAPEHNTRQKTYILPAFHYL